MRRVFVRSPKDLLDLKRFLAEELHISYSAIDEAFDETERTGAGSIYPVTLTSRQVKRLGFA